MSPARPGPVQPCSEITVLKDVWLKAAPDRPYLQQMTAMAPSEIYSLTYASASVVPMKPAELTQLLLKARAKNGRLGLTGILVHQGGSFLQTLEGNREVVEALFALVSLDKRHGKIAVLSRGEVAERSFGEWTMGFVEGGAKELARVAGFNDFFRKGFELAHINENPGRAKEIVLAFREGRFRQFVNG